MSWQVFAQLVLHGISKPTSPIPLKYHLTFIKTKQSVGLAEITLSLSVKKPSKRLSLHYNIDLSTRY